MNRKVWLITGVSGGIGRALAVRAAEKGDLVYGTLRHIDHLAEFEALMPGKLKGLMMDVREADQILSGVSQILAEAGRLDVLVNNAGYGLFGAVEEITMQEARDQMETNFFGALQLTKAVLPSMRAQQNGHIVQVSSIAGFRGTEGLGIYNASKFALEGFSEALAKEMAPFGVHITLVEPGPFRTDWAGRSSVRSKNVIEDYTKTAGVRIRTIHGYSGTQPGDPFKAADIIIEAIQDQNPPLHLPLGELAIDGFRQKMAELEKEISIWEEKSRKTHFN